jgi:hypothetical protein
VRVGLGVPILDSVPGETIGPLLSLSVEMGRRNSLIFIPSLNVMPHDKARESIVDRAVQNGCDVLLFVDSDMSVPKDGFDILLREMRTHGAQVVAGHTYRRGYPYTSTWSVSAPDGQVLQSDKPKEASPFPIAGCGMACTLIDLQWCVRSLPRPFFFQGHSEGGYFWEDWYFCSLVRKHGGRLIGVPEVRTGHLLERRFVDDTSAFGLREKYLKDELEGLPQEDLVKETKNGRCEPDIQDEPAVVGADS